jgi:hypothetical protein
MYCTCMYGCGWCDCASKGVCVCGVSVQARVCVYMGVCVECLCRHGCVCGVDVWVVLMCVGMGGVYGCGWERTGVVYTCVCVCISAGRDV